MSIIGYQEVAENTFSQKTIVEAIMSSVHNFKNGKYVALKVANL